MPRGCPTVLIVGPEATTIAATLTGMAEPLPVAEADAAMAVMQDDFVHVAIAADAPALPDGTDVLAAIAARWPQTARVRIGGVGSEDDPDVQQLPEAPNADQIRNAARLAATLFQLRRENEALSVQALCRDSDPGIRKARQRQSLSAAGFEGLLRAPGSPMTAVIEDARRLASFDVPVLLVGETATGKRTMAQAMHGVSLRSERPFQTLDCAGLPEAAVMMELFGVRGTGAAGRCKIGLLQKADRGTLYLGAIESLTPTLQTALIRAIRERAFVPVGGTEPVSLNCRLICGTRRPLADAVRAGACLPDLPHAVAVTELSVPPLRERRGDIAAIAHDMLFAAATEHGKPVFGLSAAALEFLQSWHWPGNLHELRNEITRMLIFSSDRVLGPDLVARHILQADAAAVASPEGGDQAEVMRETGSLKERVERIEARILRETLTRLKWNKSRAADELGLSRVGLRAKLERYGVEPTAPASEGADPCA